MAGIEDHLEQEGIPRAGDNPSLPHVLTEKKQEIRTELTWTKIFLYVYLAATIIYGIWKTPGSSESDYVDKIIATRSKTSDSTPKYNKPTPHRKLEIMMYDYTALQSSGQTQTPRNIELNGENMMLLGKNIDAKIKVYDYYSRMQTQGKKLGREERNHLKQLEKDLSEMLGKYLTNWKR